ncbi:MAG: hypothetical protein INR70_23645 [Parafilimonas terrae]|nr:hypothetical protein [Parafilimonas terrae]
MVRLFVAITDRDWYDALSRQAPDEVNFWQPSGRFAFRALRPGELLLFKLHAPDDVIVVGGVFSDSSLAPLSLAWEAFGTKNGAGNLPEMRRRIARYRRAAGPLDPRSDPVIGCRILTQPFFWQLAQWFPVPTSFAKASAQGKDSADHRFEVSTRLKADFDNGRHYYELHGQPVRLPRGGAPLSPDALRGHREERYRG